jgi:hypothetical protein
MQTPVRGRACDALASPGAPAASINGGDTASKHGTTISPQQKNKRGGDDSEDSSALNSSPSPASSNSNEAQFLRIVDSSKDSVVKSLWNIEIENLFFSFNTNEAQIRRSSLSLCSIVTLLHCLYCCQQFSEVLYLYLVNLHSTRICTLGN